MYKIAKNPSIHVPLSFPLRSFLQCKTNQFGRWLFRSMGIWNLDLVMVMRLEIVNQKNSFSAVVWLELNRDVCIKSICWSIYCCVCHGEIWVTLLCM
jgi:hypothetical protein